VASGLPILSDFPKGSAFVGLACSYTWYGEPHGASKTSGSRETPRRTRWGVVRCEEGSHGHVDSCHM
jgi:hypothetical protein